MHMHYTYMIFRLSAAEKAAAFLVCRGWWRDSKSLRVVMHANMATVEAANKTQAQANKQHINQSTIKQGKQT